MFVRSQKKYTYIQFLSVFSITVSYSESLHEQFMNVTEKGFHCRPLIHHYLLGCVLGRPLLFSPMCVGCMVVHVDQSNGEEREHCVRDDKVVS